MLEYYESVEGFANVGGMGLVKQWLRKRGMAFTEKARRFGLPEPKGLLLLGVQGAGKSLLVPRLWPASSSCHLLRLDLGRVFSELVGSSEQNMRTALRLAESVSPCVLWLDEIEKGLAGATGAGTSDATSARVFGSLLTWMQEKNSPVLSLVRPMIFRPCCRKCCARVALMKFSLWICRKLKSGAKSLPSIWLAGGATRWSLI
ncbi:MAG: AAA family ATPase [Anaerolineae bacterium]